MPYKKGQSGNLRGRPKENYEVKQLAREYTREAIQRLVVWMRSNNPKASVTAANALLDRGHGRPAMSGPDQGSPAKVVHEVIWSGSSEGDTSSTMREREPFVPFHCRHQRWAVIVAHRRAGKTVATINDKIRRALSSRCRTASYAYVAPFLAQAKEVAWEYLKRFSESVLPARAKASSGSS